MLTRRMQSLIPWRRSSSVSPATENHPLDMFRMEMDRVFDRFFSDFFEDREWPVQRGGGYMPAMDVREDGDHIELKAELPGLKPEDVEITLENGYLVIKGEKKHEEETRDARGVYRERSFGQFSRRMAVPDGVDVNDIRADHADGVLTVKVKKPAGHSGQAKRIPVGSGG